MDFSKKWQKNDKKKQLISKLIHKNECGAHYFGAYAIDKGQIELFLLISYSEHTANIVF